jgi:hypothetical protein
MGLRSRAAPLSRAVAASCWSRSYAGVVVEHRARAAAAVDSCLTIASLLSRCRQAHFANPCPGHLTSRGLFFGGGGLLGSLCRARLRALPTTNAPGRGRRGSRVMTTGCAAREWFWSPFPAAFRQRPSGRALPAGFGCHGKGGGCTIVPPVKRRFSPCGFGAAQGPKGQERSPKSANQDNSSSHGRFPVHSARLE